jgi:hypothetical protein
MESSWLGLDYTTDRAFDCQYWAGEDIMRGVLYG